MSATSRIQPLGEHQRFAFLDFLRGFAAIAVVGYHFGGRSNLPFLLPRSYLAVDVFFVLSGFVLANAYGSRLGISLTPANFIRLRLIRLLPMLMVGTLIGAIIEIGRPGFTDSLHRLVELLGATMLGSFAIPLLVSTSMEQLIFPINGPVWSVMFELIACAVFIALAMDRTGWMAATVTMVLGGLSLGIVSVVFKTADVGSLLTDWPGGFPRVAYSFSAGIVVYAFRARFPIFSAWVFPLLLTLIFSLPASRNLGSACLDFVIVVVVLPCLVGCAAKVAAGPRLSKWSQVSGDISYPLYAVHYPIIRAVCYLTAGHGLNAASRLLIGAMTVTVLSFLSYRLFVYIDVPTRRWLTSRFTLTGH